MEFENELEEEGGCVCYFRLGLAVSSSCLYATRRQPLNKTNKNRACISAALRLQTTVVHGKSKDAVWTLPPLAFWALAEMTCGFFIVSLPCIPKILKETGAGSKIKRSLGISSGGNTSKQQWESGGTGPLSNHSRLAGSTASNAYYRLDPLKSSESTEYLRKGSQDVGITRTTKISVMQEGDGDARYMYP